MECSLFSLPKDVSSFLTASLNGIPIPDFRQCFGITDASIEGDEAEERANRILRNETSKESKENQRLLGTQRRNRVFEFFKKIAPPRATPREANVVDA